MLTTSQTQQLTDAPPSPLSTPIDQISSNPTVDRIPNLALNRISFFKEFRDELRDLPLGPGGSLQRLSSIAQFLFDKEKPNLNYQSPVKKGSGIISNVRGKMSKLLAPLQGSVATEDDSEDGSGSGENIDGKKAMGAPRYGAFSRTRGGGGGGGGGVADDDEESRGRRAKEEYHVGKLRGDLSSSRSSNSSTTTASNSAASMTSSDSGGGARFSAGEGSSTGGSTGGSSTLRAAQSTDRSSGSAGSSITEGSSASSSSSSASTAGSSSYSSTGSSTRGRSVANGKPPRVDPKKAKKKKVLVAG